MKLRFLTFALVAMISMSMWALTPPSYYIIDSENALAGIQYPNYLSAQDEYDTETTEIRVPETYIAPDGSVYTVIAMRGSFFGYKNLRRVYIPKTIERVDGWLQFMQYVAEVEIDPENDYFVQENNLIFSNDKTVLFGTPFKDNLTSRIEVPDGVKYICASVFYGMPITSVSLPESLVGIGSNAFYYTKIREVVLPSKLKFLGNCAFSSPYDYYSGSYEYLVEIKNIPKTLIYDADLRSYNNRYSVCYDEEIYINPGTINTGTFGAGPDVFPNLKSIYKDGFHANTMAYSLVSCAERYAAKELPSLTIYANDSVIAACESEIKYREDQGRPLNSIPPMVSIGPMTPLIPGSEPENICNLDDIIITIDKTRNWIRTGFNTPDVMTEVSLYSGQINTDDSDIFNYPAAKLIESKENPGQYYIRCWSDNTYIGEWLPWNPKNGSLEDCRLKTFYDANPALFTITDNGDGSYSIVDSEGFSLYPGHDSYNILRGKADFERYNSNLSLVSELSEVMQEATVLCETEGLFPYLVNAPEQLRSEHSETREGSFANLFDDNPTTFWHSAWSTSLGLPRHELDMIFADGQTARDIIIEYLQRPYIGSKLGNAQIHWSTDGGETFSEDYMEFDETNGLNDDGGQLELNLDIDVNALRLSGTGKNDKPYWAMGELRVRDVNAQPIIEYSEEGRLALANALAEVDIFPATGNFAESIATLRAIMESIKNGSYTSLEPITTSEHSDNAAEWFNLQGRRLAHPKPGQIYIRRVGSTYQKVRL